MWALLVVLDPPVFNDPSGPRQGHKPVFVQPLVPELTVAALDTGILDRLAGTASPASRYNWYVRFLFTKNSLRRTSTWIRRYPSRRFCSASARMRATSPSGAGRRLRYSYNNREIPSSPPARVMP